MDRLSRLNLESRAALLTIVFLEQLRKLRLKRFYLGLVADQNIAILRMIKRVVLMIGLGIVKALERSNLGHDARRKHLRRIELRNIGGCNPVLLLTAVKD